jgi:hypothetical protein
MIKSIRTIFANTLSRDDKMKILMRHPDPKEVLKLMPDHKVKIIGIEGYFGAGEFDEN